ncbi:hypothetical protein M885DRAFT_192302 [Pelagophyceae sp. CCMP2097]|nr:hypothetical protein M885DRAFT_192302 [Pelagophyceae sp. CCMP2097]
MMMKPVHESSKSFPLHAAPTSIALAPNRRWLLIGCADGAVIYEPLALDPPVAGAAQDEVGRIFARGLNTCLQVSVVAAEDSRLAFAGAMKGAIDVLAFEFGVGGDVTRVTKKSDAKIRGLMATARVGDGEYRLLCGRGIKNVHVWKYVASWEVAKRADASGAAEPEDQWSLLYDLATANSSVRVGGFLGGCGGACYAKSEGQNVRVWDLSNTNDGDDGDDAPRYSDVPGTREAQALATLGDGDELSAASARVRRRTAADPRTSGASTPPLRGPRAPA